MLTFATYREKISTIDGNGYNCKRGEQLLLIDPALSCSVLAIIFITASSLKFLIASAGTPNTFATFSKISSSTASLCSIRDTVCWLTPNSEANVSCLMPFNSRMRLIFRPIWVLVGLADVSIVSNIQSFLFDNNRSTAYPFRV
jgi:hypothetical protein